MFVRRCFRYWSDNTVYAKENGGKYQFLVEKSAQLAMPLEQTLWDDLIANKTMQGVPMSVYEQDWMYNEWQGLAAVRSSATLARRWLIQMGRGAAKQNVTVQYCMSLARMALQSVEIPVSTTRGVDAAPFMLAYFLAFWLALNLGPARRD